MWPWKCERGNWSNWGTTEDPRPLFSLGKDPCVFGYIAEMCLCLIHPIYAFLPFHLTRHFFERATKAFNIETISLPLPLSSQLISGHVQLSPSGYVRHLHWCYCTTEHISMQSSMNGSNWHSVYKDIQGFTARVESACKFMTFKERQAGRVAFMLIA